MYNTPNIGVVSGNQIGGSGSAIMHLFSPRIFSNQAKRPLAYSFDNNFAIAAADAIQYGVSNSDNSRILALVGNPQYMGSVMPTTMPDHVLNLQTMADLWTFMLIVNNDKTTTGGTTQSMADNLQLYYGYFLQEPINPISHMGRITYNPNSTLVVTHKTIVNKLPWHGQYGHGSRLDVASNIDVIPSRTMGYLLDRPTMLIRPHELYNNITVSIDGSTDIMHGEDSLLQNMEGSVDIHSRLAVPKNNLKKVLDAVTTTQSSLASGALDGSIGMFGGDLYHSLLNQNLQDGVSGYNIGLPSNIIITMEYVMSRYHPELNPLPMMKEAPYAQRDQMSGNAVNACSSMLAMVVPPILTDFVMAQISFGYNSHADAMEIYSYAPLTHMPEEDVKARVNGVLHRLRHEIFPILKLQRGDFYVTMDCDTTSLTKVVLNFYCDTIRNTDAFEVPTMLGGLNTPLVASADVSSSNSGELGQLLHFIQDDDRDPPPLTYHDQQQWRQNLNTYDTSVDYSRVNTPPMTDWGV